MCSHLIGSSFEYVFTTAQKEIYAIICSVNAYHKLHTPSFNSVSSWCGKPIPDGSTEDALNYLCNTSNLIYVWL